MPEISTAEAILKAKCPRCHRGDIFIHNAYHPGFSKTNKLCPHCGLMFEREPGFFFGAMYISYMFTVAIMLGTAFVLYFGFNDPPLLVYLLSVPLITVLLVPLSFRFSRVLYLYAFGGVSYNRSYAEGRPNPK
ncbi:DUF983 domain-containing protein [Cesiribacter sp. SM1]|uniref:DUF983 domain-containing protein n=1 Tax=Cesiribacter sp. SM1 TaxID=2861196 RepID=UPI001CD5386A|nr:DUF983 domain-containing protein [Cesiribacter sp. SM1]